MASVILSGTPAVVDVGIPTPVAPQTLSLVGNTISLSGGGGAIDVATATSVSTSTQKLTAVTYDTGLLETNVAGALNVGLGSINGSTRIEGGSVVVERGDLPPAVELVDTNTATIAKLSYNGNHIRSDKDIRIEGDLELKGATPSVDFLNTIGNQKASLDYVELTDKVTLTGTNVIAESLGAGAPRILLDAAAGNATVRADDIDVRLQRFNGTGVTLQSELVLAASGNINLTTPASAGLTTIKSDGGNVKLELGVSPLGDAVLQMTSDNGANYLKQTNIATVLENTDGSDVKLKLLNQGGKFGQLIASETGGYMAIQAESGYNMLVESTAGAVIINAALPDTTISATVNGGSSSIALTDTAGEGTVDINVNKSVTVNASNINGVIGLKANTDEATITMYADPNGTSIGYIELQTTANAPGQVYNNLTLNGAGTSLTAPFFSVTAVNPAIPDQTLTATFDPANYIQLSINDNAAATGATIDLFNNGEMALSATGVLNQTADSANLSITNDLTLSALQTVISGGGVRFNQSRMNANPILPTDYAITYTQVGAFTRTLPQVSSANIGQKYIITNAGIGTLTLSAFAGQFIHANGTATTTKPITPNTTYLLTAIQSTTGGAYGWSMVGSGAPPAMTVQAATGTLTLTATMDRATYILTGTSATQNIATSLVGVPSGYCVYLRNGNNATGTTQDIAITGAATATLHAPTVITNSSYVLLFWNGTALTAYR